MDFREELRKQIRFLESSCRAFDADNFDEAIRIAQVVRTIIHSTRRSTSLLTHLRSTDIQLLSTTRPLFRDGKNGPGPDIFNGMGQFELGSAPRYYPKLDKASYKELLPLGTWWEQVVFALDANTRLTRRDIVLKAANEHGGAHVAAALSPEYERLIASSDLGDWAFEDGTAIPVGDHHFVGLRQIGFELLNSPELFKLTIP